MKGKKVYTLRSTYKDGDKESIGVYSTPRSMAVGLASAVFRDAKNDGDLEAALKAVALAVFDMTALCEFGTHVDECRYGQTVYGCDEHEVESLEEEDEDA